MLDDSVVSGALSQMADASDSLVANFAVRIRDRKLYKCKDIRVRVANSLDPKSKNTNEHIEAIDKCCVSIKSKLSEWELDKNRIAPRVLIDEGSRSPYKPSGESKSPLDRINVRTAPDVLIDLSERSSVVGALKAYKFLRAYVDESDAEAQQAIEKIVAGEISTCQ